MNVKHSYKVIKIENSICDFVIEITKSHMLFKIII